MFKFFSVLMDDTAAVVTDANGNAVKSAGIMGYLPTILMIVATIGGIIGEVVSIKGETVTIETGKERSKIRILRSAIKSIDVKAGDTGSEE